MPKIISSIILLSIILTPCLVLAQEVSPRDLLSGNIPQEDKPQPEQAIWGWFKQKALFLWNMIYSVLGREVEQRRPGVEQELKKEAEEMKQEIKEEAPSLWQRFLDLIN